MLTAAHCDINPSSHFALIGATSIAGYVSTGAEIRYIASVRTHPNYDESTLSRDVALVTLASPSARAPESLEIPLKGGDSLSPRRSSRMYKNHRFAPAPIAVERADSARATNHTDDVAQQGNTPCQRCA